MTTLPKLIENPCLEDRETTIIIVNNIKNAMRYYKIESNIIYSKILKEINFEQEGEFSSTEESNDESISTSIIDDKSKNNNILLTNNNFTSTGVVNLIIDNDEAYQMYNLKQMTYGKKFVANYMKNKKYPKSINKKYKDGKPKIKKGKPKENTYLQAIESIKKIHRPMFEPPCPWLEKRLYIEDLCEADTDWEDIGVSIREHLINLANDICIFYTSQSHFIFTIIKVEAYNVMRLLSLPAIQEYNTKLSNKLLKNLLMLINQDLVDNFLTFQEMRDLSKDLIWNYYRFPNPHAISLKSQLHDRPIILYYSMWLNDEYIPGLKKHHIDPRFVTIERNFFCKIILRRNLAALSTQVARISETLFEMYFDFTKGRFALAMANINRIIRHNESRLYRDLICYQCMVSYVSKEFFCCEEVSSLIEREYVMDNMSYQFVKLMQWLRSQRIAHYIM